MAAMEILDDSDCRLADIVGCRLAHLVGVVLPMRCSLLCLFILACWAFWIEMGRVAAVVNSEVVV